MLASTQRKTLASTEQQPGVQNPMHTVYVLYDTGPRCPSSWWLDFLIGTLRTAVRLFYIALNCSSHPRFVFSPLTLNLPLERGI